MSTRQDTHAQPQPDLTVLLDLGLGEQGIVQLVQRLQRLLTRDLAARELFVGSFQLVGLGEKVVLVLVIFQIVIQVLVVILGFVCRFAFVLGNDGGLGAETFTLPAK